MVRSRNYIATPPGVTIKEQLVDRGLSQKELAARMDMSEKHISKLIHGDVILTPETADRLEMVLGIPAKFWNNLEAIYRDKLVKAQAENEMDSDIELAKNFPYKEMSTFDWVPETKNWSEIVINLRKFFEVVRLDLVFNDNSLITKAAWRRLSSSDRGDAALLAWSQEARIEARRAKTEAINIDRLRSCISQIRSMTTLDPAKFCPELVRLFSDCGVAIVFLPHLKGTFLHGATFYDGNKIVLGLTVRGRDADRFWFSLFHEVAHILYGHIGKPEGTSEEDEKIADTFACDTLIPRTFYDSFIKAGIFSKDAIEEFANEIQISPGIVVGRLQKENIIPYNRNNGLKTKYKIV